MEGAFIPAAAKSNDFMAGAPDPTKGLQTGVSMVEGVGVAVNMPDDFGLLSLGGLLLLGPKVNENGLGSGLEESNPNKNGLGPDVSSKLDRKSVV